MSEQQSRDEQMRQGHHDGTRGPEEIEADLARTRAELDGTLNALEQSLAPARLMNSFIAYAQSSPASDYVRTLGDTVRRNPAPLGLIGAGVGWLLLSGRQDGEEDPDPHAQAPAEGRMHRAGAGLRRRAAGLGERARATGVGHAAAEQGGRAAEGLRSALHEHPFLMGAAAFGIGAALAGLLPSTRREDATLGPTRDRLVERGRERAEAEVERARAAADAAMAAAREQAESEGLTPRAGKQHLREQAHELGEKARHVAESARDAAVETEKQAHKGE